MGACVLPFSKRCLNITHFVSAGGALPESHLATGRVAVRRILRLWLAMVATAGPLMLGVGGMATTIAATPDGPPIPPSSPNSAVVPQAPGTSFEVGEFYVHIPADAPQPSQVLLAFHGMGGNGPDEASSISSLADSHGWVTIAPTYAYGDWRDSAQVAKEEESHLPRIVSLLETLPDLLGGPVDQQALLYGFSRGAQTAERLALAFPERVAGVALVSGGTYTVPQVSARDGKSPLWFPLGVADLGNVMGRRFDPGRFSQVPFWIGVGALDTDSAALPRAWDPYLGDNRVQRAQRFAEWLGVAGAPVQVQVFAGVGHEQTDAMTGAALGFLGGIP